MCERLGERKKIKNTPRSWPAQLVSAVGQRNKVGVRKMANQYRATAADAGGSWCWRMELESARGR